MVCRQQRSESVLQSDGVVGLFGRSKKQTHSMKLPQSVPFGRLDDLRTRPDADLITYRMGSGAWITDCELVKFKSRKALEAFLKNDGPLHALVKTPTDRNMLIHPCYQRPI